MPMIGHVSNIGSNVMIRRWRDRRREILQSLREVSPDLVDEYRNLGRLIKGVLEEESRYVRSRISMSAHRETLVQFLRERGPTARAEIVAKTGIPSGSLSELLRDDEFASPARGVWAVKVKEAVGAPDERSR